MQVLNSLRYWNQIRFVGLVSEELDIWLLEHEESLLVRPFCPFSLRDRVRSNPIL